MCVFFKDVLGLDHARGLGLAQVFDGELGVLAADTLYAVHEAESCEKVLGLFAAALGETIEFLICSKLVFGDARAREETDGLEGCDVRV